jgi:DeoR family transcriptional regulator of aga operon
MMLADTRRKKLIELIEGEGSVRTVDLARSLSVSKATMNRDLNELALTGHIRKTYGGAVANRDHSLIEVPERERLHQKEKKKIGAKAATLVESGETIFIEGGTTTAEFALCLAHTGKKVRVITNGFNTVEALKGSRNIEIIFIGGIYSHIDEETMGPMAVKMAEELSATKMFLGAQGVDPSGFMIPNTLIVCLAKAMVKRSEMVYLLADSSKFNRRSLSPVGPLSDLDVVISDSGLDKAVVEYLKGAGLDVILA